MALIVSGVTGRGAEEFTDENRSTNTTIRTIVSGLPDTGIDFSNRRNPTWFTLGHISLALGVDNIIWESWINYPKQYWILRDSVSLIAVAQENGLDDEIFDEDGLLIVTVYWQLRSNLSLEVYVEI